MFEEDRLSLTFQPIDLERSDVFMLWVVRCISVWHFSVSSVFFISHVHSQVFMFGGTKHIFMG